MSPSPLVVFPAGKLLQQPLNITITWPPNLKLPPLRPLAVLDALSLNCQDSHQVAQVLTRRGFTIHPSEVANDLNLILRHYNAATPAQAAAIAIKTGDIPVNQRVQALPKPPLDSGARDFIHCLADGFTEEQITTAMGKKAHSVNRISFSLEAYFRTSSAAAIIRRAFELNFNRLTLQPIASPTLSWSKRIVFALPHHYHATLSEECIPVLTNYVCGLTNKASAIRQKVTPSTVQGRLKKARSCLAATSIAEAATMAIVLNFINLEPSLSDTTIGLTDRQITVLSLKTNGFSNKEIAKKLGIRLNTVKQLVAHARRGLQTQSSRSTEVGFRTGLFVTGRY